MPFLFGLTLFASAWLTFLLQPLVGRLALPLGGGAPAVWIICLALFQVLLFAGYLYAHVGTAKLGVRGLALVHQFVLAVPLAGLALNAYFTGSPVAVLPGLVTDGSTWELALALFLAAGPAFLVLAATAPLGQRWFAASGHPTARDPYALYAVSNLGSLAALLVYPLLIEPNFTLAAQAKAWAVGYVIVALLIARCAASARHNRPLPPQPKSVGMHMSRVLGEDAPPTRFRRCTWLALGAVPASLTLGATAHLTTDIAPVSLLWVLPLALYLLSFVVAFAGLSWRTRATVGLIAPLVNLLVIFLLHSGALPGVVLTLSVHLTAVFLTGLVCHAHAATDRPSPRYLTSFFLWLAAGGVLGGLFNAVVAPLLFRSLLEYPLALALAAFLLPTVLDLDTTPAERLLDFLAPAGMALLAFALGRQVYRSAPEGIWGLNQPLTLGVAYGIPALWCYLAVDRPARFGLCVTALVLGHALAERLDPRVVDRQRSFYGTFRVEDRGEYRELVHGTTLHGRQRLPIQQGTPPEPLAYFHRSGPIGQVFAALEHVEPAPTVGVVGLGAGTLAAYARPGQPFTFFEIDAKAPHAAKHFSYLSDTAGVLNLEFGDARRLLQHTEKRFGLLVLDAFGSDAVPVHLLTREALELYLNRLSLDKLVGGTA